MEWVDLIWGTGAVGAAIKVLLLARADLLSKFDALTAAVSELSRSHDQSRSELREQNLRLALLLESLQREVSHMDKRLTKLEDEDDAATKT